MYYRISLNKDEFMRLKGNELLPVILCFARSINVLDFLTFTSVDEDFESIQSMRNTINSFLFSLAALYEGFCIIDRNYQILSKLQSFNNGFRNLLSDKKFKKYKQDVLCKMRNNYCFHFLKDRTKEILEDIEFDSYEFLQQKMRLK